MNKAEMLFVVEEHELPPNKIVISIDLLTMPGTNNHSFINDIFILLLISYLFTKFDSIMIDY